MRNLDDYPKVKHNGKLYFQVGLLTSLIAVYFIIELETPISNSEPFSVKRPIDISEPNMEYYTIEKEPEKIIAKVDPKPAITNPIINDFKKVDDDKIEDEKPDTKPSDVTPVENSPQNTEPVLVSDDKPKVNLGGIFNSAELDELPTFTACSGLQGAAQKICFNEQMKKFLQKTLRYPERAMENQKQGSVLVEFIISTDGSVSNVKPAYADKFNDKDLEKEAIRVISKLPKLKPGKVQGEPVKVRYTIPITFKLNF